MLTPDRRQRFEELLDRLTQIREVVDLAHDALATIHALELDAMTDAEVDREIRDAGGDPEALVARAQQVIGQLLAKRRAAVGAASDVTPAPPKQVWIWRAWSSDRARICDCGTAAAVTAAEAVTIAWGCLGGPWAHLAVHVDVESVTDFYLPPEPTYA